MGGFFVKGAQISLGRRARQAVRQATSRETRVKETKTPHLEQDSLARTSEQELGVSSSTRANLNEKRSYLSAKHRVNRPSKRFSSPWIRPCPREEPSMDRRSASLFPGIATKLFDEIAPWQRRDRISPASHSISL